MTKSKANTELTDSGIEVYEHDILYYLDQYIQERGIEDMRAEPQSRWNAALLYIYKYVFKNDRTKLKAGNYIINDNLKYGGSSNCNAYDIDKVNYICDLYISLCYEYDKEISIMGFCKLTGIDDNSIYEWGKGKNNSGLNTKSEDIYKKLSKEREESLSGIAVSGKRNPVGVIAVLNNKCGWSDRSTVVHEDRANDAPISREQIAADFGAVAIEQKPPELADSG